MSESFLIIILRNIRYRDEFRKMLNILDGAFFENT